MPIADNAFKGGKVFIGLRPGLFPHRDINEHITVEYLGTGPSWQSLIQKLNKWKEIFDGMPIQVHVNGYANWLAGGKFYNVALIDFPDKPELNRLQNWHITLEKSSKPIEPIAMDLWDYDELYAVCDQLWIGYQEKDGTKKWISSEGIVMLLESKMALPF